MALILLEPNGRSCLTYRPNNVSQVAVRQKNLLAPSCHYPYTIVLFAILALRCTKDAINAGADGTPMPSDPFFISTQHCGQT